MLNPQQWLWDRLSELMNADDHQTLRNAHQGYQREYGRWYRHQQKIRRLASLRRKLANPESSHHIQWLRDQIAKLEQHLQATPAPNPTWTAEELKRMYLDCAAREISEEIAAQVALPSICPICKVGMLEVDYEYLQKKRISTNDLPWQKLPIYCTNEDGCGMAGTWGDFQQEHAP